jgi:hypothetical protein
VIEAAGDLGGDGDLDLAVSNSRDGTFCRERPPTTDYKEKQK